MAVPKTTKYMIELLPECQELLTVMRELDAANAVVQKLQVRKQELLDLVPKDRAQRMRQLGHATLLTEPHKQLRVGSRVCVMPSEMMEIYTVRDMRLNTMSGGYSCSLDLGAIDGSGYITSAYITWQFDTGLQLHGGARGGILVLGDE